MGPSGGDGGAGASILFQVDTKYSDFEHIKNQKILAGNGANGQKSNKNGKSAEDLIINVPWDTEIYDLAKKIRINHPTKEKESFLICRGGKGGRGNKSFKSSKLQSPWLYEKGEEGEEKEILLKLSFSSLILFSNLSDTNIQPPDIFEKSLLFQSKIEFLPLSMSNFEKNPEVINFCKACVLIVEKGKLNFSNNLESIENFVKKFSQFKVLIVLLEDENSTNKEQKILSRYGDVFPLRSGEFQIKKLTQKLITLSNSIDHSLPAFFPTNSEDSEYVEYSDDLFPDKEELKILKTEEGWEVSSKSIVYWGNRIPQTTIHNVERLKFKLKIENIMKELKKMGGKRGEKLKVGVFETEIY